MRIFFLLFMIPGLAYGQAPTPAHTEGNGIEANYMGGRIFLHTPKIKTTRPPYSSGIEIGYTQQTNGKRAWQQRFGYPEVGLHLFYAMNGSAQLGHALGLYPSIQFRLLQRNRLQWFFKFGGGLGYADRHWQRLPSVDTLDNIIGSHLNNFSMFQSGCRIRLSDHWVAHAGVDFYHLSNAAARTPNYGINTYGLFGGASWYPAGSPHTFLHQETPHTPNPFYAGCSLSVALQEDKVPDGPLYVVRTVGGHVVKMYRHKNYVMAGIDAIYNDRVRALIRDANFHKGSHYLSAWQYASYAGHEFLFGQIGFPLVAGVYLNRPVGGPRWYQKLGLVWHACHNNSGIVRDASLFLILKTQLVQAQYAEAGIQFWL